MHYLKLDHVRVFCLGLVFLEFAAAVDIDSLDPALVLGPSPPMLPSKYTISPQKRWISVSNDVQKPKTLDAISYDTSELMENAETFWPSLRAAYHGVRVLPISFNPSGTYGGFYENSPRVVPTSYLSMASGNSRPVKYKNAGLAGFGYGTYGSDQSNIKIYNSGVQSGWSGWGNGKWGHYGKG